MIHQRQMWNNLHQDTRFQTKKTYLALKDTQQPVQWRKIFFYSRAKSIVNFELWLAYQEKLATKERLHQFGMIDNDTYFFCNQEETIQHILFSFYAFKNI